MRVACLQFAPRLGAVAGNIKAANALLAKSDLSGVDLLVLPELALSGYNFPSLSSIKPYLEATAAGPSARWAAETASRLNCLVTIGYPETTNKSDVIPESVQTWEGSESSSPISSSTSKQFNYNSTVTVSAAGEVLAHYRKTHLYYGDTRWALESPTRWLTKVLPLGMNDVDLKTSTALKSGTSTTFAICMDFNPWAFIAPSSLYEFANHALESSARLAICSMAWLSLEEPDDTPARQAEPTSASANSDEMAPEDDSWLAPDSESEPEAPSAKFSSNRPPSPSSGTNISKEARKSTTDLRPDISTIYDWIIRLTPLISAPEMRTIVIANRCGVEDPFIDLPVPDSPLSKSARYDATAFFRSENGIAIVGEPKMEAPDMTADSEALVGAVLDPDEAVGEQEEQREPIYPSLPPVRAVRYVGTSCVIRLGNGKIDVLGSMGRQEEGVLIVDC